MLDPFKVLDITENKIIAKEKCSVTIDFDDYDDESLVNAATQITLPGILEVYFENKDDYAVIGLNYQVFLQKTLGSEENDNFIIIHYNPGDVILTQEYVKTQLDMRFLIRLLHGSIKYITDPKVLINVLHNTFDESDLCHLELVISNMIRDKDDISLLGRYKTSEKDNTIVGVVKQAQTDSFLSSMAFRNFDRAVEKALVSGNEIKNNPIEKILQEDFT